MNNIDLHIHSIHSEDGEYSVRKLFEIAKAQGLELISITDHDIAKANFEAIDLAEEFKIDYLPGIEVSCQYEGVDLHVLGYNIDPAFPYWQQRYDRIVEEYDDILIESVALLNHHLNLDLSVAVLKERANGKMVTGDCIIAPYLLENSDNKNNPHLRPYFPGGERSVMPYVNFYWDFLSQGKVAYVPFKNVTSLEETVAMIQKSGGFAVLAHPGQSLNGDMELLEKIMNCGVAGIEVYSTYHNSKQIELYARKADELGCLKTYGSDYHGFIKPLIAMGEHHGEMDRKLFRAEIEKRKLV